MKQHLIVWAVFAAAAIIGLYRPITSPTLSRPTDANRNLFQVVNISSFFSESPDVNTLKERTKVAGQIREACLTTGFFFIVGHPITEDNRQELMRVADQFFKLDHATKQSIAVDPEAKKVGRRCSMP